MDWTNNRTSTDGLSNDFHESRKKDPHMCYNCGKYRPDSYARSRDGGECRRTGSRVSATDRCPNWD